MNAEEMTGYARLIMCAAESEIYVGVSATRVSDCYFSAAY